MAIRRQNQTLSSNNTYRYNFIMMTIAISNKTEASLSFHTVKFLHASVPQRLVLIIVLHKYHSSA